MTRERTSTSLWLIVTCMGRLAFLRETAPRLLGRSDLTYCLVDYSCPDRSGDWLEGIRDQRTSAAEIVVERVPGRKHFNKCVALNRGAARALRGGASHLCFVDADTLLADEFFPWLFSRLDDRRFFIAALRPDGRDMPSLTGVLVVPAAAFAATTGFDEEFRGWGGEDIEFRLRLHVLHGLDYASIPLSLLGFIAHDDELRTRFYEEPDIQQSNRRNHLRIVHKLDVWRRQHPCDMDRVRRLLYRGAPDPALVSMQRQP